MLVTTLPHVLRASATAGAIRCGSACSPPASSCWSTSRSSRAALHKILDGGWFPLALGAVVFAVMMTWRRGREILLERLRDVVVAARRRSCKSLFARSAAARAGHGGVPHRDAGRHAARAAAQPQALQGAARAQRLPDGRVPRRAVGAVRGARRRASALGRRLLARARALRLHEPARRRARARAVRARTACRSSRWRRPTSCRARRSCRAVRPGHGALARPPLRRHGAQRRQRHRLLQHPDQPRGRARERGSRSSRASDAVYQPRAMRAYAEWLWIDSKFSASTVYAEKRPSAASRDSDAAHEVFDEARIVVRALGDVLLVGALQDPYSSHEPPPRRRP